jgi:hypothetical protein
MKFTPGEIVWKSLYQREFKRQKILRVHDALWAKQVAFRTHSVPTFLQSRKRKSYTWRGKKPRAGG